MREIVSLDLDGTIIKPEWIDYIWNEAMPELYAEQEGIEIEQAKRMFFEAYDEVGKEDIRWFLIPYWFERFGIKKDCREFIAERAYRIEAYEDAIDALRSLGFAVIATNAPRELAEAELEAVKKKVPVELRLYSAVSDLGMLKKNPEFYAKVFEDLKSHSIVEKPADIVHVGDDYLNDYISSLRSGMRSYFLERSGIDLYRLLRITELI